MVDRLRQLPRWYLKFARSLRHGMTHLMVHYTRVQGGMPYVDEALAVARATSSALTLIFMNRFGSRAIQLSPISPSTSNAMEPGSTAFQEDIGLYSTQLARLQRLRGDLPGAAESTRQSIATLRALTTTNPAQTGWQRELAEAYTEQAEQSIAAGEPEEAATGSLRAALAIAS